MLKKSILAEILTVTLFIFSLNIGNKLDIISKFETASLIYFFTLGILILLVFPAIILLSFTEKFAPNLMYSRRQKNPFSIPYNSSIKITISALALNYLIFFVLKFLGLDATTSIMISSFIVTFIFGFLYKLYLEKKAGKMKAREMIMPIIIALLIFIASMLMLNYSIKSSSL